MRILVTGGAGFLGSNVAALLVARGHAVTVLDSLELGRREAVPEQATFLQGDLGDDATLAGALSDGGWDAVLHFAAYIEAGQSVREPARYLRNNTGNTLRLAEAAAGRTGHFLFASTAGVYSGARPGPIGEDRPPEPENPYGLSKWLAEQALACLARRQALPCTVFRIFNVSGAGAAGGEQRREETHLLPLLVAATLGRRPPVSLFGEDHPTPDGTCIRDYLHVLDVAEAFALALEAGPRPEPRVFNLGSGQGHSNREVIAAVARAAGRPVPVHAAPRRAGDPPALVADNGRAARELGWRPRHSSLARIVQDVWDFQAGTAEAGRS